MACSILAISCPANGSSTKLPRPRGPAHFRCVWSKVSRTDLLKESEKEMPEIRNLISQFLAKRFYEMGLFSD